MNAQADIDLVLPCYNPPSGWEERVATHFREVERLFSPVRFYLFIVSDVRDGDTSRKRLTASGN